jgi:hypothetical protein
MDADSLCWVCSLPLLKGERVAWLSSLGFEVHARCADTVLRDEPPQESPDECLASRRIACGGHWH